MQAPVRYPKRIDPLKWAYNGAYPDAFLARQLAWAHNHALAYRHKVFGAFGDLDNSGSSSGVYGFTGTTTCWRFRGRTRVGASEMVFKIGMGLDPHNSGTDPAVTVDVTEAGGSTTSVTTYYGLAANGNDGDAPYTLRWAELRVPVEGETVYEVAIKGVDYGRPICWTAYDYVDPEVDAATNAYVELAPTIAQPIYDDFRKALAQGLVNLWLANGAHLFTWPGRGNGASVDVTGTTWTNALDGSTSSSSSTPGFNIAEAAGSSPLWLPSLTDGLTRLSHDGDLPVTLAVYAQTDVGSTGEVRIADGTGGLISVTGIGTTAQWYTTDDVLGSGNKLDLQLRNGTGGQTTKLFAACLYTRAA